ncbi:MAG: cupin domain-containing protein [Verrucomicrobiota bacterium]
MKLTPRAQGLIRSLRLKPHPEGGFYREIFRSKIKVVAPQGKRDSLTQIYFMLPRGEISRWHQVLSDESWNFIEGAPLYLYRLDSKLKNFQKTVLGPLKLKKQPIALIPQREWQAAESSGDYTLVTCLVAPGFEFKDFCFLNEIIISKNPQLLKNKLQKRFI